MNLCVLQGNIVAIKYTNKKRIELNRKVLFELKHVSLYVCSGSYQSILSSSTGEQVATAYFIYFTTPHKRDEAEIKVFNLTSASSNL